MKRTSKTKHGIHVAASSLTTVMLVAAGCSGAQTPVDPSSQAPEAGGKAPAAPTPVASVPSEVTPRTVFGSKDDLEDCDAKLDGAAFLVVSEKKAYLCLQGAWRGVPTAEGTNISVKASKVEPGDVCALGGARVASWDDVDADDVFSLGKDKGLLEHTECREAPTIVVTKAPDGSGGDVVPTPSPSPSPAPQESTTPDTSPSPAPTMAPTVAPTVAPTAPPSPSPSPAPSGVVLSAPGLFPGVTGHTYVRPVLKEYGSAQGVEVDFLYNNDVAGDPTFLYAWSIADLYGYDEQKPIQLLNEYDPQTGDPITVFGYGAISQTGASVLEKSSITMGNLATQWTPHYTKAMCDSNVNSGGSPSSPIRSTAKLLKFTYELTDDGSTFERYACAVAPVRQSVGPFEYSESSSGGTQYFKCFDNDATIDFHDVDESGAYSSGDVYTGTKSCTSGAKERKTVDTNDNAYLYGVSYRRCTTGPIIYWDVDADGYYTHNLDTRVTGLDGACAPAADEVAKLRTGSWSSFSGPYPATCNNPSAKIFYYDSNNNDVYDDGVDDVADYMCNP